MVRKIIIGLEIAVIVLGALRAEGVGRRLGEKELVSESDLILIGQVVHIAPARWNTGRTMIYTEVTLTVGEVLRGVYPASTFTFSVPGGVVGETFVVVEGVPTFDEGEHALLYVKTFHQDALWEGPLLVGEYQGKVRLGLGPTI
jgi:hypothetical protein